MTKTIGVILIILYEMVILYTMIKYPESKVFEIGVIVLLTITVINTMGNGPKK